MALARRGRSLSRALHALINCDLTCRRITPTFPRLFRTRHFFPPLHFLSLTFVFSLLLCRDKQARNVERGFTNSNWTYHTTFYICFWSRVGEKRARRHLIVQSRARLMILYHTSLRAARNELDGSRRGSCCFLSGMGCRFILNYIFYLRRPWNIWLLFYSLVRKNTRTPNSPFKNRMHKRFKIARKYGEIWGSQFYKQ